ncbi:class I SAM-dependent methyltransferase [Peribacillus butanolivorans]|uniref:Eco57I restriction-modification methylase domain-containing protein n=1 Tax=Peribacillus butanolivorans TaxID=421767 RepID=UPI00207CCFB4|nr:class I SAM-dependent methyltransferase [Peribacillus butanolivorans]MCO0598512.1 class I SAM-dependent methyltransferase [Peribacillus butanolivorans]
MNTLAPTYQKLRGGYYTPAGIAEFLAQWAIRSSENKVLEPSCGDGSFVEQTIKRLATIGASAEAIPNLVKGIELDPYEAEKVIEKSNSLKIKLGAESIITGDFFGYALDHLFNNQTFDVVLGNPPFIKYQNFVEEYRTIAFDLMKRIGLSPNRMTNIWVPFLVISSMLLDEKGRLGMVIPAELFQVDYAAETRVFLSRYFNKLTIITFKELVFDDAQQEVVLILGERNAENNHGIRTVEIENVEALKNLDLSAIDSIPPKPLDHTSEKWTKYFLETEEILFLRKLKEHTLLTMSSDVIDVDVGVVTGQNKYFVLSQEQINKTQIGTSTERIVGRSNHLQGTIFSENDWVSNTEKGYPSYLFYPDNVDIEYLPEEDKAYISLGESLKVNEGYKCSIRKRWYIVPSVRVPDAFMLRQVHEYPKIILNEAGATCTDTIHRVRFINGHDPRSVSAAFLNSLTFAFAEITGRSYGGGVLTFEPSETERLPLPLVGADNLDMGHIDQLLRNNDIEAVLDITDKVLLIDGLGLSVEEVIILRGIWNKMKNRRINRKKRKKKQEVNK